jgi:hypothetical protein
MPGPPPPLDPCAGSHSRPPLGRRARHPNLETTPAVRSYAMARGVAVGYKTVPVAALRAWHRVARGSECPAHAHRRWRAAWRAHSVQGEPGHHTEDNLIAESHAVPCSKQWVCFRRLRASSATANGCRLREGRRRGSSSHYSACL